MAKRAVDALPTAMGVDDNLLSTCLLPCRCIVNVMSKWIDAQWVQQAADGRVRSTWQQASTATGRLSSCSPNLQARGPTGCFEGWVKGSCRNQHALNLLPPVALCLVWWACSVVAPDYAAAFNQQQRCAGTSLS